MHRVGLTDHIQFSYFHLGSVGQGPSVFDIYQFALPTESIRPQHDEPEHATRATPMISIRSVHSLVLRGTHGKEVNFKIYLPFGPGERISHEPQFRMFAATFYPQVSLIHGTLH